MCIRDSLYFAQALDRTLTGPLIDSQIDAVQANLARLRYTLARLPVEEPFNRLGLDLRVRQLTSILDWLAECRNFL